MGTISEAWYAARAAVPDHVTLIAVSKTKPLEAVVEAYQAGARLFGENRVQELVSKHEALTAQDAPDPDRFAELRWHQIGTLQRNKVKYIAPFVDLIHAVDQPGLLAEIDKRAAANGRCIEVLLQLHIAEEQSKFGLNPAELEVLVGEVDQGHFPHIRVGGLMGMASFTDDTRQVGREFAGLRRLFEQHGPDRDWTTLSMGMSGDWKIAVEEGSNMVRIGSAIFGAR